MSVLRLSVQCDHLLSKAVERNWPKSRGPPREVIKDHPPTAPRALHGGGARLKSLMTASARLGTVAPGCWRSQVRCACERERVSADPVSVDGHRGRWNERCRRMGITNDHRTRATNYDVTMGPDSADQCGVLAIDEDRCCHARG